MILESADYYNELKKKLAEELNEFNESDDVLELWIGFFQIEKQILHIRIVQGCAFSVKTDGLYDVLAVGQHAGLSHQDD